MIELLSLFLIFVFIGLDLGVLLLIYQEQEKFRSFFATRPVIACVSSVVTVGVALYIELYLLMVAAVAVLGLMIHGVGTSPIQ